MKTGNRIIKEYEKRISLRCPAAISNSLLQQSYEDGKYSIKLTLENTGDSGMENDTIESAAFVIRCVDSNGENVLFDDSEYLVKTINFGENGLSSGSDISMMVMLGEFYDIDIVDFEIYVNRIRYADGAVFDYLRADFFELPAKPIPLTKKLNRSETEQAKGTFGESAEYIPEKLSQVVWRCTCGEICESGVCPTCGALRDELFDYFSGEEAILVPRKSSKPKTGFFASLNMDKRKVAVVAGLSLIILLLTITLIFILIKGSSSSKPNNPDGINTSDNDSSTNPPPLDDYTRLALAYAANHQYDEAIEVARDGNISVDVLYQILREAVEYFKENKEYIKAYDYSLLIPSYEDRGTLLSLAYEKYMEEALYEEALDIARKMNDSEKLSAALAKITETLVSEGKYLEACDKALEYSDTSLAEKIGERGITELTAKRDYDVAIAIAKKLNWSDRVADINSDACDYYISIGDYDSAAKYAAASGDPDTLRSLCEKISDDMVRQSLPSYFEYLTTERKRTVLASRISVNRLAAVIAPNGNVLYGMGEIYTPASGVEAVSVAAGENHTVILLSNGKVVAFGDNSYGQCNVSSFADVVMISAGRNHTVVLMADGTVAAVGDNTYGQCNVAALTGVTMISAGYDHTLALRSNGTVYGCGLNSNSQRDVSSFTDVVSISAGKVHSVAITSDGTVLSCGSILLEMGAVSGWTDIKSVSAGGSFTVGIKTDGTLVVTGALISGSIGNIADIAGAAEICAADGCIIALMPNGIVRAIGSLAPDVNWINSFI